MTAHFPGTRILRPAREEDAIQKAQVKFLETLRAQGRLEYFAIPNEGKRSFKLANHMKAMGLRSGVPDLCILWATCVNAHQHAGFIENKKPGGKATDSQRQWGAWLLGNGFSYALVDSFADFIKTLHRWGLITPREAGLVATIPHEGRVE